MSTDRMERGHTWRPELSEGLKIGPPRWNGTAMVTDVSCTNEERVITLGVVERLVLQSVDGTRDVGAIQARLADDELDLPLAKLYTLMNQFAVYGLLERPFATTSGVSRLDAGRGERPPSLSGTAVLNNSASSFSAVWFRAGWLGNITVFTLLCALGLVGVAGLLWGVPQAISELTTEVQWLGLVISVVVASAWQLVVTFAHESSHAALFHRYAERTPKLGVTRFGLIPLPNSQLPGLALISPGQKARVVIIGPAISAALSLVPLALFLATDDGSWAHQLASVSLVIETVVLALGLSFFPNTDATRVLEAWAGVDQIQRVAFRTLSGRYALPRALPISTRIWVRTYPILLVLSLLAWVLAAAWIVWSVLA